MDIHEQAEKAIEMMVQGATNRQVRDALGPIPAQRMYALRKRWATRCPDAAKRRARRRELETQVSPNLALPMSAAYLLTRVGVPASAIAKRLELVEVDEVRGWVESGVVPVEHAPAVYAMLEMVRRGAPDDRQAVLCPDDQAEVRCWDGYSQDFDL